ncbi:uncharacterized protein LOC130768637 isoform X1 [Actinidia eriantha]|uniref:uncharacterized protein LOC130768637 isoform X1 n=2 Tax=Actinidia eriantha TaxID=165200 RepID=UPI00258D5776|nr:uncharacterized protein LOC130768637 isoform X1 [Actinidia eriantha]XP_057481701.1 uncharacterized protein LOC130768637 isoform X1 [Actinidia eriantha]XP_057481702.1 uncharacterized protein LOC130768637 isoform X1 [Actinidia eriantha]
MHRKFASILESGSSKKTHRKIDSVLESGSSKKTLKHFSHDHTLIFKEVLRDARVELSCYGCEQPICGPAYGCIWCKFDLHKQCAELPMVMKHPMHPQHSLTLFPHLPLDEAICRCAACGRRCERFFYTCSKCYFYLDTICLSTMDKIQQTIKHKSHEHLLITLERPALFFCFACGTEHRGASYLCTTCGFWINQKCASLPSTIKCSNHHHHLTLSFSLPDEYYQFRPNCDICSGELNRMYWVYYCVGCRYFSHVYCATSKAEYSRGCESEVRAQHGDSKLISLPLADQSVDPLTLFTKDLSLQGEHKKAIEINHVSHDHPLFFVDKQIHDESHSDSKLPLLNEDKHDENCNGCAQTISVPFYHCAQCNFFLHEFCAELPNKMQHPCHRDHPLLLMAEQNTNFRLRNCACCLKYCNVFMFGCSACQFYLDVRCAFLPNIIRHETHKNTLGLRKVNNIICSICNGNVCGFVFACDACNFIMCYLCALLPSKFNHRYDEHPFLLTYSPVENHLDEYYCEICEWEINPKRWFYHCVDCDQSLHTGCIQSFFSDVHLNVKFGGTLKVDKHPHPLIFAPCPKNKRPRLSCNSCGQLLIENDVAFECAPCKFRLHHKCANDAASKETS